MLFDTPIYIAFLCCVVLAYWCLGFRNQNRFLLVASYLFYGWWDWRFRCSMIGSTVIDYFIAIKIAETEKPPLTPTLHEDHSQQIQTMGNAVGLPVWVLSPPGEFPRELYRDGFHLNDPGAGIFTARLAAHIRDQSANSIAVAPLREELETAGDRGVGRPCDGSRAATSARPAGSLPCAAAIHMTGTLQGEAVGAAMGAPIKTGERQSQRP
jgi:hypothetical protein